MSFSGENKAADKGAGLKSVSRDTGRIYVLEELFRIKGKRVPPSFLLEPTIPFIFLIKVSSFLQIFYVLEFK